MITERFEQRTTTLSARLQRDMNNINPDARSYLGFNRRSLMPLESILGQRFRIEKMAIAITGCALGGALLTACLSKPSRR